MITLVLHISLFQLNLTSWWKLPNLWFWLYKLTLIFYNSFIYSEYIYSAPSRYLLRGALSPATAKDKFNVLRSLQKEDNVSQTPLRWRGFLRPAIFSRLLWQAEKKDQSAYSEKHEAIWKKMFPDCSKHGYLHKKHAHLRLIWFWSFKQCWKQDQNSKVNIKTRWLETKTNTKTIELQRCPSLIQTVA